MISFTGLVIYKSDEFFRVPSREYKQLTENIQVKLFSEHPSGQEFQESLVKRLINRGVKHVVVENQTKADFDKLQNEDVAKLKIFA